MQDQDFTTNRDLAPNCWSEGNFHSGRSEEEEAEAEEFLAVDEALQDPAAELGKHVKERMKGETGIAVPKTDWSVPIRTNWTAGERGPSRLTEEEESPKRHKGTILASPHPDVVSDARVLSIGCTFDLLEYVGLNAAALPSMPHCYIPGCYGLNDLDQYASEMTSRMSSADGTFDMGVWIRGNGACQICDCRTVLDAGQAAWQVLNLLKERGLVRSCAAIHNFVITQIVCGAKVLQPLNFVEIQAQSGRFATVLPPLPAEVGALTCYERSEAASQMEKDGVRNPLAGAQVPKSQTSSDPRHKLALMHEVIGDAVVPAASRPPLHLRLRIPQLTDGTCLLDGETMYIAGIASMEQAEQSFADYVEWIAPHVMPAAPVATTPDPEPIVLPTLSKDSRGLWHIQDPVPFPTFSFAAPSKASKRRHGKCTEDPQHGF
jgi:hypothetical protein